MCSDHLEPWFAEQGRSGFAWSWLGVALASTSLPFGVVTAPDQGARHRRAVSGQRGPAAPAGGAPRIIRELHDDTGVTHRGEVTVDRARIWERPDPRPPMTLSALPPATARRFAAQVDGLATVNQPVDDLRGILAAYRAGGAPEKPSCRCT